MHDFQTILLIFMLLRILEDNIRLVGADLMQVVVKSR